MVVRPYARWDNFAAIMMYAETPQKGCNNYL